LKAALGSHAVTNSQQATPFSPPHVKKYMIL
jgi:hypothetical protein